MIRVWRKTNNRIGLQLDSGMGSPCWNHWAILLYKADGTHVRVELPDSESKISKCGSWHAISTFKNVEGKLK